MSPPSSFVIIIIIIIIIIVHGVTVGLGATSWRSVDLLACYGPNNSTDHTNPVGPLECCRYQNLVLYAFAG